MLIGLGHSSRVGKDSIADILVAKHGFKRAAFADSIRALVYETDDVVRHQVDIHGWEGAKTGCRYVRDTLVRVGFAARRLLGEDVWVNAAFAHVDPREDWVITDVRYPNEVRALWRNSGFAVKVVRPGVEPLPNVADQALADFDEWEATVHNDGDLEVLERRTAALLGALGH